MAGSFGTTPIAIVVGAALIAAATFFGLRARPVVVASPSGAAGAENALEPGAPRATPAAAGPGAASGAGANGALPILAPAAIHGVNAANADARAALDAQHAALVAKCFGPPVVPGPKPTPTTYDFDLSFDESGHESGRGVSGGAGATSDILHCLTILAPSLEIPPRGTQSHARVRITLP